MPKHSAAAKLHHSYSKERKEETLITKLNRIVLETLRELDDDIPTDPGIDVEPVCAHALFEDAELIHHKK